MKLGSSVSNLQDISSRNQTQGLNVLSSDNDLDSLNGNSISHQYLIHDDQKIEDSESLQNLHQFQYQQDQISPSTTSYLDNSPNLEHLDNYTVELDNSPSSTIEQLDNSPPSSIKQFDNSPGSTVEQLDNSPRTVIEKLDNSPLASDNIQGDADSSFLSSTPAAARGFDDSVNGNCLMGNTTAKAQRNSRSLSPASRQIMTVGEKIGIVEYSLREWQGNTEKAKTMREVKLVIIKLILFGYRQ